MTFNEPHFIKLIFTLADTQAWLDELCNEAYNSIPVLCKRKFRSATYYLSVTALAHILERHYYKIPRHPDAGKFHISLIEILHFIKEAQPMNVSQVSGKATFQRTLQTNQHIGFDRNGLPATHTLPLSQMQLAISSPPSPVNPIIVLQQLQTHHSRLIIDL